MSDTAESVAAEPVRQFSVFVENRVGRLHDLVVLLATHNVVRWLVLAVALFAVVRVWRGWMTRAVWTPSDAKLLKVLPGVAGLLCVLGILL